MGYKIKVMASVDEGTPRPNFTFLPLNNNGV